MNELNIDEQTFGMSQQVHMCNPQFGMMIQKIQAEVMTYGEKDQPPKLSKEDTLKVFDRIEEEKEEMMKSLSAF